MPSIAKNADSAQEQKYCHSATCHPATTTVYLWVRYSSPPVEERSRAVVKRRRMPAGRGGLNTAQAYDCSTQVIKTPIGVLYFLKIGNFAIMNAHTEMEERFMLLKRLLLPLFIAGIFGFSAPGIAAVASVDYVHATILELKDVTVPVQMLGGGNELHHSSKFKILYASNR